jgi:hypothetical protein
MVLTYEDFVRSMNEQGLSILTSWQQGAIEAYAGWMKAVAPLMPDLNLYHELPTFLQDALGDPERILDNQYATAIAIVNLHREFVQEVFRASFIAPRTPFIPRAEPGKGAPVARGLPASS